MTNPPSKPPRTGAVQPQRPKTAAQRASDANKLQQQAVRANTARPGDRREHDTPRHDVHGGAPGSQNKR